MRKLQILAASPGVAPIVVFICGGSADSGEKLRRLRQGTRSCGGHRRVGGDDGATVGEERGQGQGMMQRGLTIITRVMAQQEGDESVLVTSMSRQYCGGDRR
ncbi:hypothetical protein QYE76_002190 [Lolium multiflorum]|uniref:Uncharacterized protein n=1 Tax=Lolium multiflorum TaxID=4521 RepID=A0AAD8RM29_LOLMU|nr:hypothetical protein QYE76_002190 [Lolium multiflorum]